MTISFPYIYDVTSWASQLLEISAMPYFGKTIAFILTLLYETKVIFIDFILMPSMLLLFILHDSASLHNIEVKRRLF